MSKTRTQGQSGRSSNTTPQERIAVKVQAKAKKAQVKVVKPVLPEGWVSSVRILGIDPGLHTGLAHFSDGELISLGECSPWELPLLLRDEAPMVALVIFEDSRMESKVFSASGSQQQREKIARNVGEIDGLCRIIEGTCRMYGIPCMGVPPSGKSGNTHGKKLDEQAFTYFTGWNRRSNQHSRDAALIAWEYRGLKP